MRQEMAAADQRVDAGVAPETWEFHDPATAPRACKRSSLNLNRERQAGKTLPRRVWVARSACRPLRRIAAAVWIREARARYRPVAAAVCCFCRKRTANAAHDPLLRAGFAAAAGGFCSKRTANARPAIAPTRGTDCFDTPAMWRISRRRAGLAQIRGRTKYGGKSPGTGMTETIAQTPRRQAAAGDVKLIGLVSAAHLLSHFYQLVLPPIFPLLTKVFGVGYAELGLIASLMYVASGLMQTPAGILVDRLGPSRVLIGGVWAVFRRDPAVRLRARVLVAGAVGDPRRARQRGVPSRRLRDHDRAGRSAASRPGIRRARRRRQSRLGRRPGQRARADGHVRLARGAGDSRRRRAGVYALSAVAAHDPER